MRICPANALNLAVRIIGRIDVAEFAIVPLFIEGARIAVHHMEFPILVIQRQGVHFRPVGGLQSVVFRTAWKFDRKNDLLPVGKIIGVLIEDDGIP